MTTAAPKMDPHRAMMNARRQRSRAWRFIHFLGSLKLALILLATIAIACAIATFYESSFSTKIAQAYIYKAPWFTVWLGVLCLNLFCVTLTRWPWQRKHLGFVITNYGIITLLTGAVLGSYFGFEGNVVLHRGEPAIDSITTSRSMIQVENPAAGGFELRRFDPGLALPSGRHPVVLDIPGSPLKLVADAQSDNLVEQQHLAASSASDAIPGASLEFASTMMGQHVRLPFLLGDRRDFFGLARIEFTDSLPPRHAPLLRETLMVFAKYSPIRRSEGGGTTGVEAKLSPDGETLALTVPNTPPQTHRRADVAGSTLHVGSTTLDIGAYWPDFQIANGQPGTASDQPRNPAILVRIEGPAQPADGRRVQPQLDLAPGDGGLRYQLSRSDAVYAAGLAKIGEPITLGWADWKATVTEFLPRAELVSTYAPGPKDSLEKPGTPGFRARLRAPDGSEGEPVWIPSGSLSTLAWHDTKVRVGYGLELRPVPFSIALRNFEVPRQEGTDTPANFIATVEFRDAKTGVTKQAVAQMNEPASWPGGAFAVTTGLNYKFSQAAWNPEDLGQTTLQVLYDPGWLLKWTGSLAIIVGIFIMFYLRPPKKS